MQPDSAIRLTIAFKFTIGRPIATTLSGDMP